MDLLPANRHLNRGFGDTLSRAFEFAAVVGVFLGLGWLLDRWAGTQPLFMILLDGLRARSARACASTTPTTQEMRQARRRAPGPPRLAAPGRDAATTIARQRLHHPASTARRPSATSPATSPSGGLIAAPVLIGLGACWGWQGAASAAFAIVLVIVNFVLSAALITWTARISIGLMMGAVLFGYLIRLALIFLAVWLVKDQPWVELVPLGITLIVTHLGLLVWELRYVSASLAFPGLKPDPDEPAHRKDGR